MQQKNKLYLYKTWIFYILLILCCIFASIIGTVILWDMLPFRIFFIITSVVFLLYFIYCIGVGYFTPIHISNEGIKYRKLQLSWDEIKITAYPQLNKSFQYGYYLIIDDHYIKNLNDIRRKIFINGCRVYMDKKTLPIILSHCKYKILILNPSATRESLPNSNRKCNEMLIEFNKKIELRKCESP